MSAADYVSPHQFDTIGRRAHEDYGISFENGYELRGVPATSKLADSNRAVRDPYVSDETRRRARQVFNGRSRNALVAKHLGKEREYIEDLRPVEPYGNANQN